MYHIQVIEVKHAHTIHYLERYMCVITCGLLHLFLVDSDFPKVMQYYSLCGNITHTFILMGNTFF